MNIIYIIIFLLFAFNSIVAQNKNEPALYYYSEAEEGFIVEGLQGSYQMVLAQFQLREKHHIEGPGWSISGDWFAWYESSNFGKSTTNGYFINRESENRVYETIFDTLGSVHLSWSPTTDWLLATHTSDYDSHEIVVIDPDKGVIFSHLTDYECRVDCTGWLEDGRTIYISQSETPTNSKIRLFDISLPNKDNAIEYDSFFSNCSLPVYSSSTHFLYVNENRDLVVAKIPFSGDKEGTFITDFGKSISSIYWNDMDTKAVIVASNSLSCSTESNMSIWYLDVVAKTLTLIDDNPLRAAYTIGARDETILSRDSTWSPNFNYFSYIDSNGIELVEHGTLNRQIINVSLDAEIQQYWWLTDNTLLIHSMINRDHSFSVIPLSENKEFFTLDLPTDLELALARLSNDKASIVLSSITTCARVCIYQLEEDEQLSIALKDDLVEDHLGIGFILIARDFIWSPDDEGMFILAEGSDWRSAILVINQDGTVQRYLSQCSIEESCFGWMPNGLDD